MEVKIKKLHPNAVIPTYAHDWDAGMDVTAVSKEETEDYVEYDTGLAFEVPEGYVMLIFPRSSNSKKDLLLANSVGVLDAGYRGPLKLRFKRNTRMQYTNSKEIVGDAFIGTNCDSGEDCLHIQCNKIYDIGDRVGQIMILPYPTVKFIESEELSDTDRGVDGFGSSGK